MGYRLKEVRDKAKITQEELAVLSGVSRGTIAAIENNNEKVTSTKTLLKLAEALNCTLDDIFFTSNV